MCIRDSRYPAGREATIDWPSLDNRWTNTTPYGVLVQLWVSDNQVHGRMWSTKLYDVEAIAGPRTNPRPGPTVTSSSPRCVSQNLIPVAYTHLDVYKRQVHPAGDHSVVVGEVLGLGMSDRPDSALTFFRGRYGRAD